LINTLLPYASVALLLVLLVGCVSTDELYAPYDATDCNIIIEQNSTGKMMVRDLNSNTHSPWEPAVYFDFNSHELDTENMKLLEGAVVAMTRYPQLNLSLQGFADRIGSASYNKALADRRVGSVIRYLVAEGVQRHRIVDQPLGEGLGQFGTDDVMSRSINRRVELMLLDEIGRPFRPLFNFEEM